MIDDEILLGHKSRDDDSNFDLRSVSFPGFGQNRLNLDANHTLNTNPMLMSHHTSKSKEVNTTRGKRTPKQKPKPLMVVLSKEA